MIFKKNVFLFYIETLTFNMTPPTYSLLIYYSKLKQT